MAVTVFENHHTESVEAPPLDTGIWCAFCGEPISRPALESDYVLDMQDGRICCHRLPCLMAAGKDAIDERDTWRKLAAEVRR